MCNQRISFPPNTAEEDIIDEALAYFKANVYFKNYEVKVSPLFSAFICFLNDPGVKGHTARVFLNKQ